MVDCENKLKDTNFYDTDTHINDHSPIFSDHCSLSLETLKPYSEDLIHEAINENIVQSEIKNDSIIQINEIDIKELQSNIIITTSQAPLSNSHVADSLKELSEITNPFREKSEIIASDKSSNILQDLLEVHKVDVGEHTTLTIANTKQAIKKSSVDFIESSLPQKRAIKKSCVTPTDCEKFEDDTLVYNPPPFIEKSEIADKTVKFQKVERVERDTKAMRVKRTGEYQDKLSTLLKMKENFSNKQSTRQRTNDNITTESSTERITNLYSFCSEIQEYTGIYEKAALEKLEVIIKEFLRKNSAVKVNCYDFAHKSEMVEAFGCGEIRYNDLSRFVLDNINEE